MAMRAVSSVLDVTFFLLFVSAAAVTLTLPASPVPGIDSDTSAGTDTDTADSTANVLATSTANLNYTLAPGATHASDDLVVFPWDSGPSFNRTAHGTLTEHLATAALGNLTIYGTEATHTRDDFERTVANTTRTATRTREQLVQVEAVWRPYPDAPIQGRFTAGPTPAPSATVHAATITTASGMPPTRGAAMSAARNGNISDVATVVASSIVSGYFPENETRQALYDDYPVNRLVDYRYQRFATLLGTNVSEMVSIPDNRRNVTGANTQLQRALTKHLTADMRTQFDSPTAAGRAVRVRKVTITVRTWSP